MTIELVEVKRPGALAHNGRATAVDLSQAFATHHISLDTVIANVRRAGADPARFTSALSVGLASGGADAVDLIGIAAWYAGAVAVRQDALQRLERIDAGTMLAAQAVAAMLGLRKDQLSTFVKHQRSDRWWWPGREDTHGYVSAVGGFEGWGGQWVAPPTRALALTDEGAFAIEAAGQWWRLDADVWATRLMLVDQPEPSWQSSAMPMPWGEGELLASTAWRRGMTVSLLRPAPSYLLWVHVERA